MSETETVGEGNANGNVSERGERLPTRAVCEEALGALEELFDALPAEGRAKHAGDKADVRRVLEMIIRYLGSPRAARDSEPQGERPQEEDANDEPADDANRKVSEEDDDDEDDLLDQILEDVEDLQDEERAELFGLIANLYDVETGKAKPKDRKPRTRGRTA